MSISKLRVAVLFGGDSHEKEVSFDSGRNIIYKLSTKKYEVTPLFVHESMKLYVVDHALLVANSTQELCATLSDVQSIKWSDLPNLVDFVFIALHGGKGENGAVQGALELLEIAYNGSSILASALCMNKYAANTLLHAHGFDVPRSYFLEKNIWRSADQRALCNTIMTQLNAAAVIVKPHDDGCSVYVHKARAAEQLQTVLQEFFATEKRYALIEECVAGMELTVGVIGNEDPRALVPSQAIAARDILTIEEKFLPGAGENQTPAPLSAAATDFVQKTVTRAYTRIGCKGYARIDCFYQNAEQSITGTERLIILEINTLPGLTPATCLFHQAAEVDIKPAEFLDMIIKYGLQAHGKIIAESAETHSSQDESNQHYWQAVPN